MPTIGCHSVIDRPEPVSRVALPRLTISRTKAATAKSQARTGAKLWAVPARGGEDAFAMAAVIVGFHGLWHAALRRSGKVPTPNGKAPSGRPGAANGSRRQMALRSGTP